MTISRTPAARLADAARRLRQALASQPMGDSLRSWQAGLSQAADLPPDEFADLLAQTLACTAAATRLVPALPGRVNPRLQARPSGTTGGLSIRGEPSQADRLPAASLPPFLQELFRTLLDAPGRQGRCWRELPEVKALFDAVDDLPSPADPDAQIGFYETFLAEYDGCKRRRRGVFYTPRPVVSFIVRSIDAILRTEFNLEDGLADTATWGDMQTRRPGLTLPDGLRPEDPFVKILDPATGTGTFLVEVVDHVHHTMIARWQAQRRRSATIARLWNTYVTRHLLPRLVGFELMLGPCAIAHVELRAKLAATGYRWSSDDRLRIHLTNALEAPGTPTGPAERLPATLLREMRAVEDVKSQAGMTVVLGNPPYAGTSRNTGPWITRLVDDYRLAAGQALGERNPSWLLDDYVKFLRLGQHLLDRSGCGVLGMVTNHGFIANPTFRGMRESLAGSFARIAILDLHGGVKKRAVCPAGRRDENVFDIRQGVCVSLMRKDQQETPGTAPIFASSPQGTLKMGLSPSALEPACATVAHAEIWGPRSEKFAFLAAQDISTCSWQAAPCTPPYRLFHPVDARREAEYARYRSLHDLFATKGWGLKTRKDYLLIDFDREPLVQKFNALAVLPADEAIQTFGIRQSPYWDFAAAQRRLPADSSASVQPVLFRPFDLRHVYYEKCMIERGDHKFELMRHMRPDNIALLTVRRNESRRTFDHVFCTRHMAVLHSVSAKEANFFYPVFTYDGSADRPQPNLPVRGMTTPRVAPDEFHYLYAILHSPTYRTQYGDLLRVDFPRIPWDVPPPLFDELAALGADLVALHLLEADYPAASWNHPKTSLPSPFAAAIPRFVGGSNPSIDRGFPKYDPAGRVLVNPSCGFEGVSAEVWDYRIGGYRVVHNWLKDRRGRVLSDDDVAHCRAVMVALGETVRLASRIDAQIDKHGGWPTAFEPVQ